MSKIFFVVDKQSANRLSAAAKKGQLKRLYRGIYSSDLENSDAEIIRKNWMKIVGHIVPTGILSFRTAFELKPKDFSSDNAIIFMTTTYEKTINLPGLVIKVLQGDNTLYTDQVLPNLAKTNIVRTLLENLSPVRLNKYKIVKTIGKNEIELYLAREMRLRKEKRLNDIRDEAKQIAHDLSMQQEYKLLNAIISALLSTNQDSEYLSSPYAKAICKQEPYDISRLQLFEELADYLLKSNFIDRPYVYEKSTNKNIAFFESYFSNFIEGTEFEINEAEKIILTRETIYNRHADSHDLLSHYHISSDPAEMSRTPKDHEDMLEILQERHAYLLKERPGVHPGSFKKIVNRAGSTYFVAPEDVIGTLAKGFAIYKLLPDGMPKAIFMHFLISEVHPFNDGNGRLARIMMNAELFKAAKYKIIIPNVYRDSYIGSLQHASRDKIFRTFCKVLDVTQAYTASIPWYSHDIAREKIEHDSVQEDANIALPKFNLIIKNLRLSQLFY